MTRYENELLEIHHIIKNNEYYDQCIFNIEKKLVTPVNNQYYILLKKVSRQIDLMECLLKPYRILIPRENYKLIDRSNWTFLWSKKIDYIEYQLLHLGNGYPLLKNSINYFIGMAENAISYVYETYRSIKPQSYSLVISHKRIMKRDFNNPLNLIIDHRSRDIAEYLKYLFLNRNYDYVKIKKDLENFQLDQFSCQLIYGRLLFPTYYFDMYDQIVNKNIEEKEIVPILKRVEEYEDYITNIYMLMSQSATIEKVNWL